MAATAMGWTRRQTPWVREHLIMQHADRGLYLACGARLSRPEYALWKSWERPTPGMACRRCRATAAFRDAVRRGEVKEDI